VESTQVLGEALASCQDPPKAWINSSTATIYRHAEDHGQSEFNGEIGKGFSVEVAKAWEEAFFQSRLPGEVRKIAMRTSMVIANESGTVFEYLFKLAQLGVGGKMGNGRQRVSWIHVLDYCRATEWLIGNQLADGIYNVTAPVAETNALTMSLFREISGRRIGLPSMKWMLGLGAFVMRTETEMVTKSRWVVPDRLIAQNFQFMWPNLKGALEDLKARPGEKALNENALAGK
jgi:uncharacterized protein (TIGR01777 family)